MTSGLFAGTLIREMKQLTQEEFLGLIRDDVEKTGTQKAVAAAMSVSESYLSDVLTGRRDAGDKILRHYKLRAVTNYVPIQKGKQ